MPCMDYEDNWSRGVDMEKQYKDRLDMLSRIACKALTELEKFEVAYDRLLSKEVEVATWWEQHKKADARARSLAKVKRMKDQIKREALAKLSDEEKLALGLIAPKIDDEEDE